jgi:hypothetical protein
MAAEVGGLVPILAMCAEALRCLALRYLHLHKATAKLGTVATALLAGVIQEGFCTSEAADDEGGEGGGGDFKEAEGTVRVFRVTFFPF